jgi:hypothetical protein
VAVGYSSEFEEMVDFISDGDEDYDEDDEEELTEWEEDEWDNYEE